MGEIADDFVDGSCCMNCSTYFKNDRGEAGATHGYPVICRDCWATTSSAERQQWKRDGCQRAVFKAI